MTGDRLVTAVVEALAAREGVEPAELDETLYDGIDPAILTALDGVDDGPWQFTFQVGDHELTVDSDRQVFVDGVRAEPGSDGSG
jgi:hypothetical protein